MVSSEVIRTRRSQNAQSPRHFVMQLIAIVADHFAPSAAFVFENIGDDLLHRLDDLLLGLAERDLVSRTW